MIIKPDAVARGAAGEILKRLEAAGFRIVALKMVHLSVEEAEGFYAVHRERPFFPSLCKFMASGPSIPLVIEGEDAIVRVRELMGATDPAQAEPGTIRKAFGSSIESNAIHGSDSPASAAFEIPYFFSALELHARQGPA